jgi:hypothetical protein
VTTNVLRHNLDRALEANASLALELESALAERDRARDLACALLCGNPTFLPVEGLGEADLLGSIHLGPVVP